MNVLSFFVKWENKNTGIWVHLTSEYKLYPGMNFITILSSSFKSRRVLLLYLLGIEKIAFLYLYFYWGGITPPT